MSGNLVRVSRLTEDHSLPFQKSTFYKLNHLRRYPGLFIKVGWALFIDTDVMNEIIERGRLGKK